MAGYLYVQIKTAQRLPEGQPPFDPSQTTRVNVTFVVFKGKVLVYSGHAMRAPQESLPRWLIDLPNRSAS
jgi:hypothetical protein